MQLCWASNHACSLPFLTGSSTFKVLAGSVQTKRQGGERAGRSLFQIVEPPPDESFSNFMGTAATAPAPDQAASPGALTLLDYAKRE